MKIKLLVITAVILATPIASHAVTPPIPPDGFCGHAPLKIIEWYRIIAGLLGLPTC
jgi:hypothetical protein